MTTSTQQDIYKLVQERKMEFYSLYARMAADRDLLQVATRHPSHPVSCYTEALTLTG